MCWVCVETAGGYSRGEIVVADPGVLPPGHVLIGEKALVPARDGSAVACFAKKVRVDSAAGYKLEDLRILPVTFDAQGVRRREFAQAVAAMVEGTPQGGGLQLEGPATALNVLKSLRDQFMTPTSFHEFWLRSAEIPRGDRSIYEHEVLSRILESIVTVDQLNVSGLQGIELLVRRLQVIREAHRILPSSPDYSSAEFFMGWKYRKGAHGVDPDLAHHVAAELKSEAMILKESRKAKEEAQARRRNPGDKKGGGLSTSARRRKARVRGLVEESNRIIDTLNEMYAPQQVSPQGECTLAQRSSQHAIFKQLARQSKAHQQCSMREAVQELLQCDSSYSQEDFVSTVRPYQRDLISLPETGDDPVSLDQVLDEHGRQVLGDPLRTMLLSDEEWGEVLEKGDLVRPYMDVRLQHDQQLYTSFIQDLHAKGMISFTWRPREIVCIPEGSTLYLAQSDIKDYFYSLALPHELQSLFCLPAIAKSTMQDWGLDLDQVDCDAEGWTFPMLRVVLMGWSWAMWVAQRVHTHLCMEAGGLSLDRVIVESKAPPDLSDGEVIIIPYADNLNVAGIDEQRVQQVKNKIVDRLREIGFRVREELEACSIGQSLGFLVDGAKGVVAPIPERLHKVRLALDWLARQPWVTGKQVERLIGHCVHFMLLRRELLSIFRAMYDFAHKSYSKKRPLFASAAREAKWASALLGLCSVDLRKDWSGRVTASDASLSGVAVCCRELPRDEVAAIGSQREPWRYKYKELPPPREAALNFGDPFSDPSTVKPLKQELEQPDPFELNEKFVEVPQNVLQPELWQEVFAVHMKHPEHITLLETRGVVISLRHKFRAVQHFGKRHLHLGDNMGMILMIAKGRSSSFSMLKLCRRLCALLLCADSMLSPRWIPSELNVADKGRRPADKAKTRAEIARQRSDPPRFKGQTNLERVAVSEAVAKDYTRRTNDLRFFARQSKISLRSAKNLDEACTLFLNNIFEQGVELHEGSKFVAAVKDAFPDFGHKSALPRMIRALQGWTKIDPQKTRPPLPWELVAGIAMKMQARTRHHAALAVLTMFSAYLRPGECLGIQKTDLVRPMPRQEHHTLHLHPAERHEASKVGISEESIQLDSVQLLWLGQALEQLQTDGPFLFELGHAEMVSAWKQALVDLGLEHNHAVLHQL
ncbi:unnamed protein product [Durusdinium trenchii]|uniref:Uncharacterized protein n=1 Tax=Durusdinium trenchii TaxID=1381693 RepID=A0ABP0HP36_9DINO